MTSDVKAIILSVIWRKLLFIYLFITFLSVDYVPGIFLVPGDTTLENTLDGVYVPEKLFLIEEIKK